MIQNVLRAETINRHRVEIVRWDNKYSVYVYDREGLLNNDVKSFNNYTAALKFYLGWIRHFASSADQQA